MILPFTPREVTQARGLREALDILGYQLVPAPESIDRLLAGQAVAQRDDGGVTIELRLHDQNYLAVRVSWIALAWSALNGNTRDVLTDLIAGQIHRVLTSGLNGGAPDGGAA